MPNLCGPTFILLIIRLITTVSSSPVNPNGPRIEIRPSTPIVLFEAQTGSNRVLTCKALGDKPSMFNTLRWSGPNRSDNWEELMKKHKVREVRNGLATELEFIRPTPDDSGLYWCHGTYQSSDVYNASVIVKIYNPIKLENCPERQFVIEGAPNQHISCRITGDSATANAFKDNMSIEESGNRYKWNNDDGIEIIGSANKMDAGLYTIEVTADITGERRNHYINVEVHSRPEIKPYNPPETEAPIAEFSGIESEQAELKCEVSGNPRPLVYWLDPRLRNLTSVGGYFVNPEKGTLLIGRVNRVDDHGIFKCLAFNTVGEARRNVSMVVLQRPAIVAFENKTVDEGSEVEFECRATGYPRPVMTVRRHGLNQLPYRDGDGSLISEQLSEEGGGSPVFVYRLRIRAYRSHYSIHYCNATNMAGSAERVGQLTVRHKPDLSLTPPEQYFKLGKNVSITCHIKAFPQPRITWYAENRQIINAESNFKTSPDGQTHIVTMMPPLGTYSGSSKYTCYAENDLGYSQTIILTRYYTPPGLVNAVILDATPTTIKLELGVSNDGGDRIKRYKYRAEGVPLDLYNPYVSYPYDRQNETYIDAALGTSIYTIRNLYPYYRYKISVKAINDAGEGDVTEISAETRRPTEPDPPVIVKPSSAFSGMQTSSGFPSDYQNGYVLKWSPPELDNGDPIQRYIIRFYKVDADSPSTAIGSAEQRVIEQMNERPMFARLAPLEPNERYRFELQARNKYGDSKPAHIIVYTSADKPPIPDYEPATLPWLVEPSTPLLVSLLILALACLIITDMIFCMCFQMGVIHSLRNRKQ